MNLHERVVGSIRHSTQNVFSTMLGIDIGEGEAATETSAPEANDGVVSFIGLAGPLAGTGSLCCSGAMSCRFCTQLLGAEAAAVNEEVLDVIAELTNMILGNVKTDLEIELGAIGLSIPTVIFGMNFRAKTSTTSEWHVVRFVWEGETLQVRLCLTPREPAHRDNLFQGMGHACAPGA